MHEQTDPGRIRIGAVVYFGADSIPCHIIDVPAQEALAQGAFNESTTQVVLAPFDGGRAADVPDSSVPYAEAPTAGAWSFTKHST